MIKLFIAFFFISIVQAKDNYKRSDFNYESYSINIEKKHSISSKTITIFVIVNNSIF